MDPLNAEQDISESQENNNSTERIEGLDVPGAEGGISVHLDANSSQKCESDASASNQGKSENGFRKKVYASARRTRSFPPPLPCLAKSHSQFPHGMPLVLLQPFRGNGRFVLQEIKVAPPAMFQTIRRDGRFVLQLVRQVDDYYWPVYGKGSKLEEKFVNTSTANAETGSVVVQKLDAEQHMNFESLNTSCETFRLQCSLTTEAPCHEIRVPSDDGTVVSIAEDSELRNTGSETCTDSSSHLKGEDAGSQSEREAEKVAGSAQRFTMKPPFEGRCFPKERGLDWHLASLHVTSVLM